MQVNPNRHAHSLPQQKATASVQQQLESSASIPHPSTPQHPSVLSRLHIPQQHTVESFRNAFHQRSSTLGLTGAGREEFTPTRPLRNSSSSAADTRPLRTNIPSPQLSSLPGFSALVGNLQEPVRLIELDPNRIGVCIIDAMVASGASGVKARNDVSNMTRLDRSLGRRFAGRIFTAQHADGNGRALTFVYAEAVSELLQLSQVRGNGTSREKLLHLDSVLEALASLVRYT